MPTQQERYPNCLKIVIKEAGYTLKEVSEAARIPRTTLSYYLAGKGAIPHRQLQQIASLLGYTVQELRARAYPAPPPSSERTAIGDDVKRRAFLQVIASLLGGNLPLWEELLSSSALSNPSTPASTALLPVYQYALPLFWDLYFSSTADKRLDAILSAIADLQALAQQGAHQPPCLRLLSQYHQLAGHLLRNQRSYRAAIAHADQAIQIAQSIEDSALLAAALARRAFIRFGQNQIHLAVLDMEAALALKNHAGLPLRGEILQVAGHYSAQAAQSQTERTAALLLLDQAGAIASQGRLEDDGSFVHFDPGWYHSERARALLALRRPTEALEALYQAERLLGPVQPRRRATLDIQRAKVYVLQGAFEQAAGLANDALAAAERINSSQAIARIEELYQQLVTTPYHSSAQLRALGQRLATIHSG